MQKNLNNSIVILLAAGKGQRIRPLTEDIPKALIEIEGITLLQRLMVGFCLEGAKKFVIVTGHKKHSIIREMNKWKAPKGVTYERIFNPNYENMNNSESVRLALQESTLIQANPEKDIVIVNTDIVFNHNLLKKLYNTDESALLSDGTKILTDESMKVALNDKGYLKSISKKLDNHISDGEYIGIAKIKNTDIKKFYWCLKWLLFWCDKSTLFYEHAIYMLTLLNINIKVHSFDGHIYPWTEIDTYTDYAYAKRIVKENYEYPNS